MPFATFKSVREVSSEDTVHPAQNLLQQQLGKKWRTKSAGEKSAYVILELEKPCQITGIDIGNEHSAFIEVLVGKAGCASDAFTEILVTCSFMTPVESKNSTNVNRVRCFNQEALVETVTPTKWQMVKIICTQPFNKHVQYGLAFIKLHVVESAASRKEIQTISENFVPERFLQRKPSAESKTLAQSQQPASACTLQIGKFTLREDSPDSESESTAALFARWKATRNGEVKPLSTAAAIRQASTPTGLRRLSDGSSKPKLSTIIATSSSHSRKHQVSDREGASKILDRNRERLLFGDDDDHNEPARNDAKTKRLAEQIEADRERLRLETEKLKQQKEIPRQKRISEDSASTSKPRQQSANPAAKKTAQSSPATNVNNSGVMNKRKSDSESISTPPKKPKVMHSFQYRPFNQLLKGVVLVISGIQNPVRSDLRGKALSMGAKYKQEWEPSCTHLICAFKNTPKYNQVHGKGKIVTRSWIEKCYALKKYLPWRRYALDSNEQTRPESDEEILDETLKPTVMEVSDDDNEQESTKTPIREVTAKLKTAERCQDQHTTESEYNACLTSGSDTEDELQRVTKKLKSPGNNKENEKTTPKANNFVATKVKTADDAYEVPTDEEDYLKELSERNNAQRFFRKCKFFICLDITAVDKLKLEQFITKCGGAVVQNRKDAHYALTNEPLERERIVFKEEIVRPLWVFECNDMGKKVSTARYLL